MGTLSLTGSSEFHLQNDPCSSQILEAFETFNVDVIFSPVSLGFKTGTLTIPSNDEDNPLTLGLIGRGIRFRGNPEQGTIRTPWTIGGSGFGVKKEKVYPEKDGETKSCKLTE